MSEMAGQDNLGQEAQGEAPVAPESGGEQEQSTGGINPAWNDLLESMPSSLHSQITPHLTKWDQGVQQKIQQVHSQYEPYKPFLEQQIEPDKINYAMSVMQAIEERPQEVLQALQEWIGEDTTEQQGQSDQQPDGSEDVTPDGFASHPEFKRMQDMVETMAQLLVQQQEEGSQAEEDALLEEELSSAKQTHGDFDEEWVLTKMLNNPDLTMDAAVKSYKQFEQGIMQKLRQPGPPVLSPGGQIPNQELNPAGLDDKGRRNLIVQMLSNAHQQGQ